MVTATEASVPSLETSDRVYSEIRMLHRDGMRCYAVGE